MKSLIYSLMIALLSAFSACMDQPETHVLSSDGVKISFEKKGIGKPALVFVHGWSNNRSIWDDQMAHFSEIREVWLHVEQRIFNEIDLDLYGCTYNSQDCPGKTVVIQAKHHIPPQI